MRIIMVSCLLLATCNLSFSTEYVDDVAISGVAAKPSRKDKRFLFQQKSFQLQNLIRGLTGFSSISNPPSPPQSSTSPPVTAPSTAKPPTSTSSPAGTGATPANPGPAGAGQNSQPPFGPNAVNNFGPLGQFTNNPFALLNPNLRQLAQNSAAGNNGGTGGTPANQGPAGAGQNSQPPFGPNAGNNFGPLGQFTNIPFALNPNLRQFTQNSPAGTGGTPANQGPAGAGQNSQPPFGPNAGNNFGPLGQFQNNPFALNPNIRQFNQNLAAGTNSGTGATPANQGPTSAGQNSQPQFDPNVGNNFGPLGKFTNNPFVLNPNLRQLTLNPAPLPNSGTGANQPGTGQNSQPPSAPNAGNNLGPLNQIPNNLFALDADPRQFTQNLNAGTNSGTSANQSGTGQNSQTPSAPNAGNNLGPLNQITNIDSDRSQDGNGANQPDAGQNSQPLSAPNAGNDLGPLNQIPNNLFNLDADLQFTQDSAVRTDRLQQLSQNIAPDSLQSLQYSQPGLQLSTPQFYTKAKQLLSPVEQYGVPLTTTGLNFALPLPISAALPLKNAEVVRILPKQYYQSYVTSAQLPHLSQNQLIYSKTADLSYHAPSKTQQFVLTPQSHVQQTYLLPPNQPIYSNVQSSYVQPSLGLATYSQTQSNYSPITHDQRTYSQTSQDQPGYSQTYLGYSPTSQDQTTYSQTPSSYSHSSQDQSSYSQIQSSYAQSSQDEPSYSQTQSSYAQTSQDEPSYSQSQSSYVQTSQLSYLSPSQDREKIQGIYDQNPVDAYKLYESFSSGHVAGGKTSSDSYENGQKIDAYCNCDESSDGARY